MAEREHIWQQLPATSNAEIPMAQDEVPAGLTNQFAGLDTSQVNQAQDEQPFGVPSSTTELDTSNLMQAQDVQLQRRMIPLDGKLITNQDPATIGTNFRALTNMRYTDTHVKSIKGHTKINTTAISLTSKETSLFHFKKDIPAESHVILHHDGEVYENTTAIPSAGDFAGTALFTDTAASQLPRFSTSPDGSLAYCNGTDVCLWPGTEGRIGAFITSTAAITTDATDPIDATKEAISSSTVDYVILGGGIDSNVKTMLHCDGADGATSPITDSSNTPKTFTARGTAQLDTSQYKLGYSSLLLDGNSDWVDTPDHADFAVGSNLMTCDFWIRFNAVPEDISGAGTDAAGIFGQRADSTHYVLFQIVAYDAGGGTKKHFFDLHFKDGASDVQILNDIYRVGGTPSAFTTSTWYHIALIRGWGGNANAWAVTVNGTLAIAAAVVSATSWPNIADVFSIGRCVSDSGASHYVNGWIDEFRFINGECPWTANFSVPTAAYTDARRDFLVGSTLPLKGMKVYVSEANSTSSTLTMKYWDGVSFVSHAITDNTSSGGKSLAVTGTVTWVTTVGLAAPRYSNGYFLYWYNFSLSAGSAKIYHVTVDAPFQGIKDIWDGVERNCLSFILHKTTDEDYTTNVYKEDFDSNDATTYADLSNLTANTQYIYAGFAERTTAINVLFGGSNTNSTASTTLAVYYWNGAEWMAISTVTDGTASGGISFSKSGTISWTPPSDASEAKTKILTDKEMYYYKLVFDKNLDGTVYVNYVSSIPKQKTIGKYKFPLYAQNSLFLCGDKDGNGNKAIVSSPFTSQAFNGESSYELEFEDEINGAVELYSQFFSSLYSLILFFSNSRMYIIAGVAPDWGRYVVSNTIGCPAPNTIRMINLPETKVPAALQSRNVAIWQGNSGIYVSDGRAPIPIHHDIEDLFDQNATTHINTAMLSKSWGFVDPVNECYHWLLATGSSTTLNKEMVFDYRRWKWFEVARPSTMLLQSACVCTDTYGNEYIYGMSNGATDGAHTDGFVYRLNYGATFDGTAITCTATLGDFPLIEGNIFDETIPRKLYMILKSMSHAANITYTHAVDGYTGSSPISGVTITNQETDHRVANKVATFPASSQHLGGVLHSGSLSITQSTSETTGFEPLVIGYTYQIAREHST